MRIADVKLGKLIEVGVAVADLRAATRTFADVLGVHATAPIRAPMFSMDFCMCRLGTVDFELMAPTDDNSVIKRFLARRGEGLHHIAFQVTDLDETVAACKSRGATFTSDKPVALEGLRAAFLRPEYLSGLLVEFVENSHNWSPIEERRRKDIGRVSGFGVAVNDLDAAASGCARLLGAVISDRSWNQHLSTYVRFAMVSDVRIELVPSSAFPSSGTQPIGGQSGLRHVCLDVFDRKDFNLLRGQSVNARSGNTVGGFLTDPSVCHGVAFEVQVA